jgi:hypothetical protein
VRPTGERAAAQSSRGNDGFQTIWQGNMRGVG